MVEEDLIPSTSYLLDVCAYNNAGEGPCQRATATTSPSRKYDRFLKTRNKFIGNSVLEELLEGMVFMSTLLVIHSRIYGSLQPIMTDKKAIHSLICSPQKTLFQYKIPSFATGFEAA